MRELLNLNGDYSVVWVGLDATYEGGEKVCDLIVKVADTTQTSDKTANPQTKNYRLTINRDGTTECGGVN